MKLEEFQHLSKNVKFIVNKFSENPGRFASIVIQMYWATKDECDSYKQERDTLIADIIRLRAERDEYKQKIVYISNQYSTEIEQALNNKELQESLFLLEKIKMDLDEVLKDDNQS
ncbi:hypothetical protein OSX66_12855 [Staphylococcus agnetis]|uniref:hypothetical protein n=1 Tax=Staphylococcus agnetis TaxID=985762 RepID=UPI00241872B9|nr:hypothetical protein [Staphylococcus agnetis]MDG4944741.1 hypothetical protein [Staphylococcus agnetis]